MVFFEALSFSSTNEDGATELSAFQKEQPRRLLCLTGSGSRVLDMCIARPDELIALDLNPTQNELLRLKIAAFRVLDDRDLLAYLGVSPCNDRLALHARVERALTAQSRSFWLKRLRLISKGVWYGGLWERVLRAGALGNRVLRGKKIDRLFAARTLGEQTDTWRSCFDDRLWRGSIRLLGRPWVWARLIGEPGGNYLPSPETIERRLAGAFNHAAETFFFRESDFASLILRGHHEAPHALPLHLQSKFTDTVRDQIDRIRIVDGGLTDLQTLGVESIDAFSISDFGSYCSQAAYDDCWDGIRAAATPGATVCEREFLNALAPPTHGIFWDKEMSDALSLVDKSFIYKIRVGKIGVSPLQRPISSKLQMRAGRQEPLASSVVTRRTRQPNHLRNCDSLWSSCGKPAH